MVSERTGYGHPPNSTRFRKGRSGNPKGRPKGSRSLATIVARAISQRVIVTENGRRRRATKLDVAVMQLVNKAASGDFKSLRELLKLVQLVVPVAQEGDSVPRVTPESDRKVIEALRARILRSLEGGPNGSDTE